MTRQHLFNKGMRITAHAGIAALCLMLLGSCGLAPVQQERRSEVQPLTLAVQPMLSDFHEPGAFHRLADYLSSAIGRPVVLHSLPNMVAYWDAVRRADSYDLILDAAHFTDYRVRKFSYDVLGRFPGQKSFSLLTLRNEKQTTLADLIGKPVATPGAPSLSAAKLAAIFPNPMRQPVVREVEHVRQAIEFLYSGKVQAAMVPAEHAAELALQEDDLRLIAMTEPVPDVALSASPALDHVLRRTLRNALVDADTSAAGQAVLAALNIESFDYADNSHYEGYSKLLVSYWGY